MSAVNKAPELLGVLYSRQDRVLFLRRRESILITGNGQSGLAWVAQSSRYILYLHHFLLIIIRLIYLLLLLLIFIFNNKL